MTGRAFVLGGWAPKTDGYVVNNHGGSKSTKDRVGLDPETKWRFYGL